MEISAAVTNPPLTSSSGFLSDPDYREGFGKNVTGGAGKPVCVVNSSTDISCFLPDGIHEGVLNDRTVVFGVNSVTLPSNVRLGNNVTVDGCANGQNGVTFNNTSGDKRAMIIEDTGPGMTVGNVIIRCLNFRGSGTPNSSVTEYDNLALDGTNGGTISGVLIDRITSMQASDGALDITGDVSNVTVQRSLFYGNAITMLIKYGNRQNISIHHNVFTRNGERNPQVKGAMDLIDFVNNVEYLHDVQNYPDGSDTSPYGVRIWSGNSGSDSPGNVIGNFADNVFIDSGTGFELIADSGASLGGVYIGNNYCSPPSNCPASPKATPNAIPAAYVITTLATAELKTEMLPYVGAPNRTALDQQRIDAVAAVLPGLDDTTPPSAPTDLTATAVSSTQINLSWTASTDNVGVAGYLIYRDGSQITTTPGTSYHDTDVSPSTTYTYTVEAYDGADNVSDPSNEASATTPAPSDTESPSVPTELVATVISSTQIDLSWTASTDDVGVTGYIIYRNGKEIGTTAGTSYQSILLKASTSYTYRVLAYDEADNRSMKSAAVAKTTQPSPSTKFTIGGRVRTIEKTNVRSAPSRAGTVLGTQAKGVEGGIVGGPWYWNQRWWWEVDFDNGEDGWIPQGKLKKVDAQGQGTANYDDTTPRSTVGIQAESGIAIQVDAALDRHAIDARIYGVAWASAADLQALNAPVHRWGGNSTTRHNWKTNADNRGSDWYFESIPGVNSTPGYAADSFVADSLQNGAAPMLTIPMIGWVGKTGPGGQKLASFSAAKYGAQQDCDWAWFPDACNGVRTSGTLVTGNDPNDANVPVNAQYQKEWVQHLVSRWGGAASGGVRYYIFDNEPSLWHGTHRDVHPTGQRMTELRDVMIAYGTAIRQADPAAVLVGPEEWGWMGYFWSGFDQQYMGETGCWSCWPDRNANGGMEYLPWLLGQLRQHEQTMGVRVLDLFTVHYYPQGGEFSDDVSTQMQQRRNRSTRSLWDPNYVDETWINDRVRLVPRLREWVSTYYSGLETGITEYNWGAENHINGATTQADILGIFGREGLNVGTRWGTPPPNSPTFKAFQIYRNYDGNKSAFGNTSVRATVPNPDSLSAFAAERGSDGALTVMVINKVTTSALINISLANFTPGLAAQVWQLASTNTIQHLSDVGVASGTINTSLPAQSITLFVVPRGGGALPSLSVNDTILDEGNAGSTNATFTVTLSAPSAETVTVNYATANGTATAGTDYTATSGILTFSPGQTSKTISIAVNGDTAVEPNETFFVNLSSPTNATLADSQGQGTINNDDAVSDTEPPTAPTGLTATVISSTEIDLSWAASTDNVGVTGYIIYRNGKQIGTTASTSYQSTGLRAFTSYTYSVAAYDGVGNKSAKSVAVIRMTQPIPSTKFKIGDRVRTVEKANVRSEPTGSGTVSGTQPKGAQGGVIGGPWYWNQRWWWHVDFDSGTDGWVAQGKLKKVAP